MVAYCIEFQEIMENASTRLRQLMTEVGLNQVELAEKIGKTKSLISSYLNPDNKPSDIFLHSLEDKMGWSARWIRTGKGERYVNGIRVENSHNRTTQIKGDQNAVGDQNTIKSELASYEAMLVENENLRRALKAKDDLLQAKDDLIQAKDVIIQSKNDKIELLKKSKNL